MLSEKQLSETLATLESLDSDTLIQAALERDESTPIFTNMDKDDLKSFKEARDKFAQALENNATPNELKLLAISLANTLPNFINFIGKWMQAEIENNPSEQAQLTASFDELRKKVDTMITDIKLDEHGLTAAIEKANTLANTVEVHGSILQTAKMNKNNNQINQAIDATQKEQIETAYLLTELKKFSRSKSMQALPEQIQELVHNASDQLKTALHNMDKLIQTYHLANESKSPTNKKGIQWSPTIFADKAFHKDKAPTELSENKTIELDKKADKPILKSPKSGGS